MLDKLDLAPTLELSILLVDPHLVLTADHNNVGLATCSTLYQR